MSGTLIKADNAQILNAVRKSASLSYRDRIPIATQANIEKTVSLIRKYPVMWNEFLDVLVNRIGLTVFRNYSFENKLKPLKKGTMNYGGVVQELGANLLSAHAYDPDATDVFNADKPDVRANYHVINRRDRYDLRINEDLLTEAMLNDGQLSSFINSLIALPAKSDEWDEYLLMRNLLKTYEESDGFANFQVPNLATSSDKETDGKTITEAIRLYYLKMKDFYSRDYNAEGMDAVGNEMILLATPEFFAALDVNVLAAAFHMDKADFISDGTVIVDDFGISGCQAILVDRDFYQVYDTKIKSTSIFNPKADETVYYLHHWGIYSVSRMVNALMFSTNATTLPSVATKTVTGVTVATDPAGATAEPGADIQLKATVTYSDSSTDANAYFILTASAETAPTGGAAPNVVLPDTGTYVDRGGVLHIAEDSTYDSITVTAVASADPTKTANVAVSKASDSGD